MAIGKKVKLSDVKTLTVKSCEEIDELLVEMKKMLGENSRHTADVIIQWERMAGENITEIHSFKFQMFGDFDKLVRVVHDGEENHINFEFSATIKLKLEKKDKQAELALKEKQMEFFSSISDEDYKGEVQEFVNQIDDYNESEV